MNTETLHGVFSTIFLCCFVLHSVLVLWLIREREREKQTFLEKVDPAKERMNGETFLMLDTFTTEPLDTWHKQVCSTDCSPQLISALILFLMVCCAAYG